MASVPRDWWPMSPGINACQTMLAALLKSQEVAGPAPAPCEEEEWSGMSIPAFSRSIPDAMEEDRDGKLVPQHSSSHRSL